MMRWGWIVLLVSRLAAAQRLPDVGEQIRQSRDFIGIQDGCVLRFDQQLNQLVCASAIAGKLIDLQLGPGTTTTLVDSSISVASLVTCGCSLGSGGGGCNEAGRWLAWVATTSVEEGSFTVRHTYSAGNAIVRCVVQ